MAQKISSNVGLSKLTYCKIGGPQGGLLGQGLQCGAVMATNKSFSLRSNKFPDIICRSLKVLRSGEDFADVTLACEDGNLVKAHKVILAGSSPFFGRLLRKLNNPHPLIYLKGVTLASLLALLDFVYTGEAEVEEEGVAELLLLADQLQIAGLKSDEGEQKADGKVKREEDIADEVGLFESQNGTDGIATEVATKNIPHVSKEQEDRVIINQNFFDPKYPCLGSQKKDFKLCSVSGLKEQMKNADIKAKSFVRCDQCDQILTSKKVLKIHIRKQHIQKSFTS